MKQIILLFAVLLFSSVSWAHEQGDWILRAGAAMVDPNDDSDAIDVLGVVTLPGVDVGDDTQLGITGVYMVKPKFGIELLAATPFKHEITLSNLPVDAGDTKQLPPTLMLQYYPMDNGNKFQPYVGLGVNTTIFFEEDVDDELNLALDGIAGLPPGTVDADLSLKQSWGLSAQIGFDYMLNDNWLINGSIWYTDIDTEAKIKTALGTVKFDVEIDPWVYMLSVGYRF
ncbi:MAG TPA: outer membrane protein OmpW [Pseudomonadales bacterium]|jgi:outer membrane protein|nr:outer membrane protein OmpW [Gammaproteobacteria bacterium]HIL85604.1 outer membrane protein OmpW [Pseudomonadales bacterium]